MSIESLPAIRVLVLGGVANLGLSFVLGCLLLLGLAFALGFAKLDAGLALIGAWLLVVASIFQDASGIANWLRHTDDQFAEHSFGWVLASINAVLNTAGLAIVVYGVFLGLY